MALAEDQPVIYIGMVLLIVSYTLDSISVKIPVVDLLNE